MPVISGSKQGEAVSGRFAPRDIDRAPSALGRSLPQSPEAEESLLSCCLLDGGDTIARCLEGRISADAFAVPANRTLFDVIVELYQNQLGVDMVVLAEELGRRKQLESVGGVAYLAHIGGRVATAAQAGYFIERVRECAVLRRLITAATSTVEKAFDFRGGFEEFIDKVEQDIFAVTQDRVTDNAKDLRRAVKETVAVIDKMIRHKGELTGISSGFSDLDKYTFGFQRQDMIVLAARPSMGKTALALNIAEHAALPSGGRSGVGVLVFSLEMSSTQLTLRMLCSRSRVRLTQLRAGTSRKEDYPAILEAADEMSKAPLWIDDSAQMSIMEMRAKARRLHARNPLGLVIVDYLQLASPTDAVIPREQQIAEISRGLKAMAKELNLPVIVLSQLNRESEKEKRQPRLSDLRESGSIEQDADVVLLLARPRDATDNFEVATDTADLIIAKQRNGSIGQIRLTFLRDITRFENFTA